jgi:lipopolysaccharide export system permease protein
MRTLHKYLTRQVVASLFMTVAVFTFVLLLVNVLREIMPLLVSGQVKLSLVAKAFGLLVPFVWVFALPMGLLTATLLIFGRFSADQELTAVRAGGISLIALISPILVLSLLLCGVCAMVNMEYGPRCRVAYNRLRKNLPLELLELSRLHPPEGRFVKQKLGDADIQCMVGKDLGAGNLQDITVFQFKDETNLEFAWLAPKGNLIGDTTNQQLIVVLRDYKTLAFSGGQTVASSGGEITFTFPVGPKNRQAWQPPDYEDMTFSQLQEELHTLQRTIQSLASRNYSGEETKLITGELVRDAAKMNSVLFHMSQQVAFSFACFGFTLIGIPLGIRMHRRETNVGIGVALFLVATYYGLILIARALENRPECAPYLLVWMPNFIFQAVGGVLLWRANRR